MPGQNSGLSGQTVITSHAFNIAYCIRFRLIFVTVELMRINIFEREWFSLTISNKNQSQSIAISFIERGVELQNEEERK